MGSTVANMYYRAAAKQTEEQKMVDIPDLPLEELEQAMATEAIDESLQDEAGGSVVFGVIGAGQGRWSPC